MKQIAIAGIGTRDLAHSDLRTGVFDEIVRFTKYLVKTYDLTVRSGHAKGSDYAFECGAGNNCKVFSPWKGFGKKDGLIYQTDNISYWDDIPESIQKRALESVELHHPMPGNLRHGGRLCMARNYFQVMDDGPEENPVVAVICCAKPSGKKTKQTNLFDKKKNSKIEVSGGTGQAVRIANAHGIPVFNLWTHTTREIWPDLKVILESRFR